MSQPSPDDVRKQLRKIAASSVFVNAERMRRFLEFSVEHALRSPTEPLKEMIVGVELYALNGDMNEAAGAADACGVIAWEESA